jgi:Uma2 family endonuclease
MEVREVKNTRKPRTKKIQKMEREEKYITVAEWEQLPEEPQYELIDGVLYMLAKPVILHQRIMMELGRQFGNYLLGKKCNIVPESNLRLDINKDSVFEPDLTVVCDPDKLKGLYIVGAPDLIVEILSPSTASRDCILKLNAYKGAGVREYWIVDPVNETVIVFSWEKTEEAVYYSKRDKIKVGILEDFEVDLSLVFAD